MPEEFAWTLSSAPEPDEPALPEPPARPPRSRWSWRRWSILAAILIVTTLAAAWGYGLWNANRLRQDINRVIAAEPPPVMLPSPVLRLVAQPPRVSALTRLSPDRVQADVTRAYLAPDGATLHFTRPQFYDYRGGAWQAGQPPGEWSTLVARDGAYVEFGYSAGEADLVEKDLAPYLDDVLARACADWTCPPGTQVVVNFSNTMQPPPALPDTPAPADPLLFAFARARNLAPSIDNLLLPQPHLAGYPADAASLAWWKRALAVQALTELANRLTSANPAQPSGNAFLYALTERLAQRLGLEPAATPAAPVAQLNDPQAWALAVNVNEMWDFSIPVNFAPAARGTLLRSALAATTWLLRGQPAPIETRLLHAVGTAHNQTDWLTQSLGIGADEAWARMQLAVWQVNRPAGQPTLALSCAGGIAVTQPGQPQPIYFWAGSPEYSNGQSTLSPDGRWMALRKDSSAVFLKLDTGELIRPPGINVTNTLNFSGWVSNTIAAFINFSPTSPSAQVDFVDVADPQRVLPPILDALAYRLAPDRQHAAILSFRANPEAVGLALIPALGGPKQYIDASVIYGSDDWAAWSPDSAALVYAHQMGPDAGLTLRIADAASGAVHELHNRLLMPELQYALLAWSATQDQFAFVVAADREPGSQSWLGLVQANGADISVLSQQRGTYTHLAFSADGQFLAASSYANLTEPFGTGQTLIFDANQRRQVASLSSTLNFAWSPTHHQLAVIDANGTSILTDLPADQRQPLTLDNCTNIAWGPPP